MIRQVIPDRFDADPYTIVLARLVRISANIRDFQHLVALLGGEAAPGASARAHKAFRRARAVKSAQDLLRLLLMYGPGVTSLPTAAAMAAQSGIVDLSDVPLLNRVRGVADWLQALCGQLLRPTGDPRQARWPAPA